MKHAVRHHEWLFGPSHEWLLVEGEARDMNGFPGSHEWVFRPRHEWDFGELRNTVPPES